MEVKSQDWYRADIKSALEKRGITLRVLSRDAGLSPDSLRNVFSRSWPGAKQFWARRQSKSGHLATAYSQA